MRVPLLIALSLAAGLPAYTFKADPAPPAAAAAAPALWLEPFEDRRVVRPIYQGRNNTDQVSVEAQGLEQQSAAWQALPYAHMALLWHRQLGQALAAEGLSAGAAREPGEAPAPGAAWVLGGKLQKIKFTRRGADGIFGTSFSGVNYNFDLKLRWTLREASGGRLLAEEDFHFRRVYHDPVVMGSRDKDTFPAFLLDGLEDASRAFAQQASLRRSLGLPTLTPSPTATATPRGPKATPTPAPGEIQPSFTPTPDVGPRWINPRTRKRVDPSWNFDPEDGTPRKDFVLLSRGQVAALAASLAPTPTPTPTPEGKAAAKSRKRPAAPTAATSPGPAGAPAGGELKP